MKDRYPLIAAIITLTVRNAAAQSYGELNINDVRARFHSHGLIGHNLGNSGAAFEVPQNGGAHALYSAGLWVAGVTLGDTLHTAGIKYEAAGSGDYYNGPLTVDGSASTNAGMMGQFNHVWSVTSDQVALHTAYFACLNDPDCDETTEFPDGYNIPPSFFDWPAINPDPAYDTYCAPFYDYNNDGDYDPAVGDAPCILGDQALFHVFNDKGGPHLTTNGNPIGIEVRSMPFAYSSGAAYLHQTVFVHYHLVNRGTLTLDQTRIGFFNDFDLGNYADDFVGTDPGRNLTYVYNQDNIDDDGGGSQGYGTQPPAFGMVLLKGPMMEFNGADDPAGGLLPACNGEGFGDQVTDNERSGLDRVIHHSSSGPSCCNDPSIASHYYDYLRGIWKDGTPLTYGGNGYSVSPGAVPAHFSYPGASDPLGAGTDGVPQAPWAEADMTYPDRRTVASAAPFTLYPGQHIDLLFAYVFARAASGGPLASVAALQARVDSVRAFAHTLPLWGSEESLFQSACDGVPTTGIVEAVETQPLSLFPVPAADQVQVMATNAIAGALLIIHDATGRVVATHLLSSGLNDIDIRALARGAYTCEVRTAKAHYTGRLMKE